MSVMPPRTKIFVGKLPPQCKDFELRKLFDSYGEVTECTILGNYGFVHMKTEDQAVAAIQSLNNWDLNGSKISVEQSTGGKRSGGLGMRGGGGGMRGGRGGRGMRGGFGGRGGRGMGGPMRGRGVLPPRVTPYERRPYPVEDRYGPPPPAIRSNGYYDDYDRRERTLTHLVPAVPAVPAPIERRPIPPVTAIPRDPYRDHYERYEAYERLPPPHPHVIRRTPPPVLERRPPPVAYDRRDDPYDIYARAPLPVAHEDLYVPRDPYAPRPRSPLARVDRRYPAGPPPPIRELPPRHY